MRPPQTPRPDLLFRRTLDIAGEKWTLLVLREAFYGVQPLRRFPSCDRLCAQQSSPRAWATLVEHGILERQGYREPGSRPRSEYRLTNKGRELFPALVALLQWGDRWTADPEGPAVELRHDGCEAGVGAELRCRAWLRDHVVRGRRFAPPWSACPGWRSLS